MRRFVLHLALQILKELGVQRYQGLFITHSCHPRSWSQVSLWSVMICAQRRCQLGNASVGWQPGQAGPYLLEKCSAFRDWILRGRGKVVPGVWQQTWSWEVQCWSWTDLLSSADSAVLLFFSAILFWAAAGREDWLLFSDITLTSSNFKNCSCIFSMLILSFKIFFID